MLLKQFKKQKAGKVTYRTDKEGNVHLPIGRVSFDDAKLVENFNTIYDLIVRLKPTSAKGTYIKKYCSFINYGTCNQSSNY